MNWRFRIKIEDEKMERVWGKKGQISYGHDIGILMIDCHNPFIPGDVGNAYTYDFPVLFHLIPEVTIKRLVDEGDLTLSQNIVDAARYLQRQGVKAITSDCGYMIHFQDVVREAVDVPVMMSSLLQLPLISAFLPASQSIGIICAKSKSLTADMLSKAFPAQDRRLFVAGMEDQPEFRHAILDEKGSLDPNAIRQEVVTVGKELVAQNPSIGAVLFECSNLPPYAKALQDEIQRPVFDFTTMINFVRASCVRRNFEAGF
ncbi:MAG: aspartate/glutamate racemase [Parasphingorhabdus sp.]|jgi:aspartate/glutamate racemase